MTLDPLAALATAPGAKALVLGGIGSGKTTALETVRNALRTNGTTMVARVPRNGDGLDAAIVIDDVQLLSTAELDLLTELAGEPGRTVVVSAEPLAHAPALNALTTTLSRQHPPIQLAPMTPREINDALTRAGVPAPHLAELVASTGGIPLLMYSAVSALASGADPARATAVALSERLRRLDEHLLDTLLLCSLSPELGPDDIAAALGLPNDEAAVLMDRARASGLLSASLHPNFTDTLHRCLTQLVGAARHRDTESRLLRSQIESSTLSTELALKLAEHGTVDDLLAADLIQRAAPADPTQAARLYRAAARAGSTAPDAHLADALAVTGDCATAGVLADQLLTAEDADVRAQAVRIAASVAMHDGAAAHAADLFRWLGPCPDPFVAAAGATVGVATADADLARTCLQAENSMPPTSSARAARGLAEGLLLTLDQPFGVAIARLTQAVGAANGVHTVAPDSPAALLSLVALHGGDAVRARSVIGRAVRTGAEGFSQLRHRLLLGWIRMLDGQLDSAVPTVPAAAVADLHRRDALWLAALQTGVARRTGDTGALQKHWYAAMEVLAEYSLDLFALLPLGELWVAAARLQQVDQLRQPLSEAFGLLRAAGNPVLWSVPLHWAGVHAGILANAPEAVAPHGQALAAASRAEGAHGAYATALAGAGRAWLRVLADGVDAAEVTTAARGLARFGLTWDATRLASQAALHSADGRISGAMLQLARDLKQDAALEAAADPVDIAGEIVPGGPASTADVRNTTPPPAAAAVRPASAATPAWTRLSDREREVAELVLQGMPYRDIGARLLISAKTVEHHVARIRRRLGAESRSEMLSMLRALLVDNG
ncbi:helix-turn-helix transcriptional regulator [Mycobacterium sp. CBMA293]|uniref:isoniazid response ATPase/transcriptional regulator IniR n=1 Tax=unclassified Mycolicibacterium TaxID=2636767 RepID=UPI0012DF11F6|nr:MULTISPECIES: isoniazid response ATPase/transcriptional regulator IniR [unclassified Mycolicibacterium]MUL47787.1 helix-turn-helix transcriptional regulator [Mycolicibacterium sp. CBMA 360]MUL61695.1 helix-turn-helix transcriptional regulator [Mycolicibacterium sp. CBMA 335]MUL70759.1 helix-turn-helix transcriptional regulator [Mycolicibacterium sp. CBMA 311]MUL97341.1 helix-turn-helix transcriptional regulator [Mycolicibacterium sp. CBMA 230]MUM08543.1 helix-turn-helix transcriptional regu